MQTPLRKSLTTFDGIALLIGITIGSGIYSTPYIIAGYYESYLGILITWLTVAGFVMIGGLIYAELGTRFPTTGGEYVYLNKAFGPYVGFLFGWAQLFIIRTSPGAGLAIVAADYVGYFMPLEGNSHTAVALSFIVLVGLFNYVGIQWAARFQGITTVMKVAGLLLFVALFAFLLGGAENRLSDVSAPIRGEGFFGTLIPAVMLILFTHTGYDRVGYVAGEMKNPREIIPRSMIYGLGLIILIYVSVLTIYHYVLGMDGLRETITPAADIAATMIGPFGASAVAILAIVSAVSSINGTTTSSTRVYYAMARDGLLFKAFNHIDARFQTPTRAIIAHVIWASVILIVRGSFENIAAGMIFAILIFYSMTTLALFKFRREKVNEDQAFRMPGYPVLPAIYLVGVVSLLVFRAIFEWEKSLVDLAFVASGIPVSIFWFWKRKQQSPAG